MNFYRIFTKFRQTWNQAVIFIEFPFYPGKICYPWNINIRTRFDIRLISRIRIRTGFLIFDPGSLHIWHHAGMDSARSRRVRVRAVVWFWQPASGHAKRAAVLEAAEPRQRDQLADKWDGANAWELDAQHVYTTVYSSQGDPGPAGQTWEGSFSAVSTPMFATKYKYAFRRLPDLSQFFAEIQFKSHSFSVEILTDFFLGILGNPVVKRRLPHSFDGHSARATSMFSLYFSLQHFNFLLFSIPMFPFSYNFFQTDPQANYSRKYWTLNIPENLNFWWILANHYV